MKSNMANLVSVYLGATKYKYCSLHGRGNTTLRFGMFFLMSKSEVTDLHQPLYYVYELCGVKDRLLLHLDSLQVSYIITTMITPKQNTE